jgi:4-diphosphocytidyl-2-C-methyl-D-erythritol kinase
MNSITLAANAKINITLDIIGKREDGYHDILTVMQEIDLCDIVTVCLKGKTIRIICDNSEIPTDNRNIAYKAAEMFMKQISNEACMPSVNGVEIVIQKRIPIMAGLGGSSTNGAAVLKALNHLFDNRFDKDYLLKIGAKLGADVPFFIIGGRAECRGIGDIITPLNDKPTEYYAIIKPDFGCDTKGAYQLFNERIKRTKSNIFQNLYNDERINEICDELMNQGAQTASMTGSGSAVFGVFSNRETAKKALEKLNKPFKYVAKNIIKNEKRQERSFCEH